MKQTFVIGFVLLLFAVLNGSYALEWKNLHEEADRLSLSQALLALEADPASINNLYVLGLVYLNEHKNKEANEVFNRILALDSRVVEAKWGLAETLRREHKIDQSETILNEIIKTNPDFSPAYISLAYISIRGQISKKRFCLHLKS